jgi:hypothetical protein
VKLLCLFRQCRWHYFGNLVLADDAPAGLYQCTRCKSLSLGAPTDPRTRELTCNFRGDLRYTEFDYCVLTPGHLGSHEFPNGTTMPCFSGTPGAKHEV